LGPIWVSFRTGAFFLKKTPANNGKHCAHKIGTVIRKMMALVPSGARRLRIELPEPAP